MYILLVETTSLHPLVETYFVFSSSSSLWCDVICECPHRKGKLLVEVTDFSLPSFFASLFHCQLLRVILTQLLSLTEVQKHFYSQNYVFL